MKKMSIRFLAAIMGLSLLCMAACGGTPASTASSTPAPSASASASTPATAPASSGASVEIRAAWWGDTKRHELYNQILDEFEKKNTGVTVIREPTSWNDYWDKLSVQTAGGNAPEFMGMHPQYASDYIGRGVLEPLDSYVQSGTIQLEGWEKSTIETGVVNGVNYMVPMGVTFSNCFVNLSKFEALGITAPKFDWTWDDMKTIGQEVRAKFDAAGEKNAWLITDVSTNLNTWRYYVRQQGRELYNSDGTIGFTQEDAETWWTMFKEFRDLGIVPDGATSTEYATATLEDSLFSKDKTLVQLVPVNQYKLYCTTFPDKTVGIIRNPVAAGKAAGEFPEGAHFAVSSKSTPEKKQAAAQLLNFWVNDEASLALFGLDQGVPGNLAKKETYMPSLDEYQLKVVDFVNTLSAIGTPTTFAPAGASEIDALFKTMGEGVMFGQKTPAAAAKEFYEQAQAIRAKK